MEDHHYVSQGEFPDFPNFLQMVILIMDIFVQNFKIRLENQNFEISRSRPSNLSNNFENKN